LTQRRTSFKHDLIKISVDISPSNWIKRCNFPVDLRSEAVAQIPSRDKIPHILGTLIDQDRIPCISLAHPKIGVPNSHQNESTKR
jgi:hypothetical protein